MNGTTVRRSPGGKGTPQAEPESKLPQTAAEVLGQHVVLETESIDRMYLNVFVGRLQILEGALRFIRQQRKAKVLSTTAVEPMTRTFVQFMEQFVKDHRIPLATFEKRRRKDEVAAELRAKFPQGEGVVFVDAAMMKVQVTNNRMIIFRPYPPTHFKMAPFDPGTNPALARPGEFLMESFHDLTAQPTSISSSTADPPGWICCTNEKYGSSRPVGFGGCVPRGARTQTRRPGHADS